MGHYSWSKSRGSRHKRVLSPVEVADCLSRRFRFDQDTEQFFTFLYGILNCRTGEFRWVSAGHPGPACVPRNGKPHILRATGLPIGVGEAGYREHTLQLARGDRLYLYTDGVTDAADAAGELFGKERILASLDRARDASLEDSLGSLLADTKGWRVRARDDVSVVALEWTGLSRRGRRSEEAGARSQELGVTS